MDTYKELDSDFNKKYRKEIEGIARYNNVDLSVAKEMFKTNLHFNDGLYKGGGVAENWGEMLIDYKKLQQDNIEKVRDRVTTNSLGQKVSTNDLISPPAEEKKTE